MSLVLDIAGARAEVSRPTVVGRGADCELRPDDLLLSRRHFRLVEVDGVWHAEDVGSASGTWLNGALLRGSRPLAVGDELKAGGTVLRVTAT